MSTLHDLQDLLMKEYPLSRDQLKSDAALGTLGLDSLSILELMFKIEDHFHLKIVDDTPMDFVTVSDVVSYVDRLLTMKDAAAGHESPLSA